MHPDDTFTGKNVLVTGAAGSVGGALSKRLLALDTAGVWGLDNNETDLFAMAADIGGAFTPLLGDVRDYLRCSNLLSPEGAA